MHALVSCWRKAVCRRRWRLCGKITCVKGTSSYTVREFHTFWIYSFRENKCGALPSEQPLYINQKNHINKILPKLSSTFVVRSMYTYSNMSTLKIILNIFMQHWNMALYYGGNSTDSKKAFLQRTRIIRIMTGSSSRTPCKLLFQRLEWTCLCNTYCPLWDSWQRNLYT